MDRTQVVAAGVGVSASALLLALGVGLVCDARTRDVAARERAQRDACALLNERLAQEQEEQARRAELLAGLREQVAAQDREWAARRQAAREQLARAARDSDEARIQEWDEEARARVRQHEDEELAALVQQRGRVVEDAPDQDGPEHARAFANECDGTEPELRSVREAALTGDVAKLRSAIAKHNARTGATPVYLSDDPALASKGVAVRARYDKMHNAFGVMLEARAGSELDRPITVLVAPGTIVKAATGGYQDTAPIQARFLKLTPRGRTEAPAAIACANIHSNDPTPTTPRGLTRHADPRVALVAAAAEREHAGWGEAQVALWAVANEVTLNEVLKAPGNYGVYVSGAREVLEAAGIDTNKLPLYAHGAARGRKSAFGIDVLGRGLRPMGG